MKALDEAVRKVGAQSVLIGELVAARAGLNATDLRCLDLLLLSGSTTAGGIAAHTGLTSGATTAVIDRLERAGFVKRRRDPRDRRVVVIEVQPHASVLIARFYAPLLDGIARVHRRYADRQLATFVDYLSRALQAGADHVAWLQTQPAVASARRPTAAAARKAVAPTTSGKTHGRKTL